jgi:hypothetical protein
MRFSGALSMGAIRALMPAILVTTALALSGSAGAQAGAPLFVADQEAWASAGSTTGRISRRIQTKR